jgi:RNA polymerase sigma-B factor
MPEIVADALANIVPMGAVCVSKQSQVRIPEPPGKRRGREISAGRPECAGIEREQEYAHLEPLLAECALLEPGHSRKQVLRQQLITGYLALAENLARHYRHRGVPFEDLVQVATVGLIHAIDRYDPRYGRGFLPYAIPTIKGELRRYFRDCGWATHVPRRTKELSLAIARTSPALTNELGRPPRPSELAAHFDVPAEEVIEALQAHDAYTSRSLDAVGTSDEGETSSLRGVLGHAEEQLELVEYRHSLRPLLDQLPQRERTILMLRFFGNMSQSQIGERVGCSQMHVSRLLRDTLTHLRRQLLASPAALAPTGASGCAQPRSGCRPPFPRNLARSVADGGQHAVQCRDGAVELGPGHGERRA